MAINMDVLEGGLGDDVGVALDVLAAQSQGALRGFRSDFPFSPTERNAVLQIMLRIQNTLDWAPRTLFGSASAMMDRQAFPLLNAYRPYFGVIPVSRPSWLQDQFHLDAWYKIADAYAPLEKAFAAKQLALVRQEGERLATNAAFWDTVAKYSGAAYLQKVWGDFWEAVGALKAQQKAAKVALDVATEIVIKYGSRLPANLVQDLKNNQAQYAAVTAKAKSLIAPLGATVQKEAGLGLAPMIIAGIAVAAVVSITAGVWAIVNEFTSIQRQANSNANDLMKRRDEIDAADFAAGRMTEADLQARRNQSAKASNEMVEAQGAAQVGNAIKRAGEGFGWGIGTGVGAVALIGIAGFFGYRYLSKRK